MSEIGRKPDLNAAAVSALLARAFGTDVPVSFERVREGIATQVYKLVRGSEVFFLKAAEDETENLAVDAELLRELRNRGVRAPEVVYLEPFDATLSRSVLIMTCVAGRSLEEAPSIEAAEAVARAVGSDLALLNQVAVRGFGFVLRSPLSWPLAAELASYGEFVGSFLPADWPGSLPELFTLAEVAVLEELISRERRRPLSGATLAHGDFDVTHIFHVDGLYSGIIDFGEIRGTEPFFDLGHFLLHDCESFRAPLFDQLVTGYEEVERLPPDGRSGIQTAAILLGLRQLCRWLGMGAWLESYRVRYRAARLKELLGSLAPGSARRFARGD